MDPDVQDVLLSPGAILGLTSLAALVVLIVINQFKKPEPLKDPDLNPRKITALWDEPDSKDREREYDEARKEDEGTAAWQNRTRETEDLPQKSQPGLLSEPIKDWCPIRLPKPPHKH